MKTFIILRSSPDYRSMTKKDFEHQIANPYLPRSELQSMVENSVLRTWENLFRMDYLSYRAELADIARFSLEQSGCHVVSGPNELREWLASPEDGIAAPVDDDDWMSPLSLDFDGDVLWWPQVTLKSYNTSKWITRDEFRMGSNNWAVQKKWLQSLGEENAIKFLILSHRHAEERVRESACRINREGMCLSIYNRHCASLALLRALCQTGELNRKLREIARRIPTPLDDQLPWASDLVRRLEELNLRLRRRMMC